MLEEKDDFEGGVIPNEDYIPWAIGLLAIARAFVFSPGRGGSY